MELQSPRLRNGEPGGGHQGSRKFGALDVYISLEGNPIMDLAFEEQILREAEASRTSLFLYTWANPVLVLGYGQRLDSLGKQISNTEKMPMLRRMTGGTGVLRDRDLGISLALPSKHPWTETTARLYAEFVGCIAFSLEKFGVHGERVTERWTRNNGITPLCFENRSIDSLLVRGKKVLGCAQARRRGGALVHGVLLLGLNAGLQGRVFGLPSERIEKAMAPISLLGDAPGFIGQLVDDIAVHLEMHPRLRERSMPSDVKREPLPGQCGMATHT